MPWAAALLCCAPFDLAVHEAYGQLLRRPVFETFTGEYMNRDLAAYVQPAARARISFRGNYPADFFVRSPAQRLATWHLVGELDSVDESAGLADRIQCGGFRCLQIQLRGSDERWDYERIRRVGSIAGSNGAHWLEASHDGWRKLFGRA